MLLRKILSAWIIGYEEDDGKETCLGYYGGIFILNGVIEQGDNCSILT